VEYIAWVRLSVLGTHRCLNGLIANVFGLVKSFEWEPEVALIECDCMLEFHAWDSEVNVVDPSLIILNNGRIHAWRTPHWRPLGIIPSAAIFM
jgi:hypothetical protein